MMRKSVFVSFVLGLALAAGCGEAGEKGAGMVEAASKKASETYDDLSKLTPEAAKEKVTSLVDQATTKLSTIKDAASAENVQKEISPLLDQLSQLKTSLGSNLDLSSLEKAVKDVIAKFTSDPGVAKALQPLLDKIQGLMK
jgi:hypothetical protein